jgi:hypothetical protein
VHAARELLAEQVGKMTLKRTFDEGEVHYRVTGQIDFFGEDLLTRVGGAGGRIEHCSPRIEFRIEVAA